MNPRIEPHQLIVDDPDSCCNCGDYFGLRGAYYDNDQFLFLCFECACEIDPDLEYRMFGDLEDGIQR